MSSRPDWNIIVTTTPLFRRRRGRKKKKDINARNIPLGIELGDGSTAGFSVIVLFLPAGAVLFLYRFILCGLLGQRNRGFVFLPVFYSVLYNIIFYSVCWCFCAQARCLTWYHASGVSAVAVNRDLCCGCLQSYVFALANSQSHHVPSSVNIQRCIMPNLIPQRGDISQGISLQIPLPRNKPKQHLNPISPQLSHSSQNTHPQIQVRNPIPRTSPPPIPHPQPTILRRSKHHIRRLRRNHHAPKPLLRPRPHLQRRVHGPQLSAMHRHSGRRVLRSALLEAERCAAVVRGVEAWWRRETDAAAGAGGVGAAVAGSREVGACCV